MMLEHLGQLETARRIREAIQRVTQKGETLTPDLGGKASTMEMAEAIMAELRS